MLFEDPKMMAQSPPIRSQEGGMPRANAAGAIWYITFQVACLHTYDALLSW
jgi:hypothetical protein